MALIDLAENLDGKNQEKDFSKIRLLKINPNIPESTTVKSRLIEIINFYQEYNDFVVMNQEFMEITQFFCISTNAIGVSLCVVAIFELSISVGIVSLIIMISHIAYPCVLGTIISHQNDRLVKAISDFPFYKLDVADQKIFLQFLTFAQNTQELNVAIYGDVNMELLQNVLNVAYSYFMFLFNFI